MSKSTYWVVDPTGVYGQVEGADQRDLAVRQHGWIEADEPGPTDQVYVVNEHPEIGPGRLPYGALESGAWGGRGWKPGPPPELAPAAAQTSPVDEPAKPTKSTPAAAAGGEKKEK